MNNTAQQKQPNPFLSWLSGVAIVVMPLVWFGLFVNSTVVIAKDPAAGWWADFWILLGASWLLFIRKGKQENRLIVEISIWLAAVALLITRACL